MANLLNLNKEKVAEIYLTQEINQMRVGSEAHFETEKTIRASLGFTDPGFLYIYKDGRIVNVKSEVQTLIGYWEE